MALRSPATTAALFAAGLTGVVTAVNQQSPDLNIASNTVVCLLLVLSGIVSRRKLVAAKAPVSRIESATAAHMGLIWLWGALALITVYPLMMSWREWPHFFGAFLAAGLVSLGYARLLSRDADAGRDDPTMLQLGRYLAIGQLAGMAVTIAGLIIDPDKEILYINEVDWAANGIFFTGALALLLITAEALSLSRTAVPQLRAND